MKKKILMIVLPVVVLAGLVFYGFMRSYQQKSVILTSEQLENEENAEVSSEILVHVAGAVVNPGVYTLKSNARVIDAIDAAGGMTEEADPDAINLAAIVSDGDKIHVYTRDETTGEGSENSDGLININTASKEELMTLSGIGEVLAENIIAYREKNGGFSSKEELKEVDRIGDKLYEKIEELITV